MTLKCAVIDAPDFYTEVLCDSAGGCGKLHAQRRHRRKRDALHALFSVPAITRDDVVYWHLIEGEYYLKPVDALAFYDERVFAHARL